MIRRKQSLPAAVPAVPALLAAAAGLLFACQFQLSQPNQYIVCTSSSSGATNDLWRINWDGTGAICLTQDDPALTTDEIYPLWSHDGNRIFYIVEDLGVTPPNIWMMTVDGRRRTQITFFPNPAQDLSIDTMQGDFCFSLSPDGKKVAFSATGSIDPADPDPDDREIFTINADGIGLAQLTVSAVDEIHPAWSPDGRSIVFVVYADPNYDICTMENDGGNVRNLTNSSTIVENRPVWSPDGSKIAYMHYVSGNNNQIWVLSRDGSQNYQVGADIGFNYFKAVWSPDSARLAYYQGTAASSLFVRNVDLSGTIDTVGTNVMSADWSPTRGVIVFYSNTGRLFITRDEGGASAPVDITPAVPLPAFTLFNPKCSPR